MVIRAAILIVLIPSVALAQSRADEQQARTLFEQGVQLSSQERWAEALEAFRASRAIVNRPSTVYNIATSLQRMGRIRDAIETLEEYLGLTVSDPAERAEAEQLRGTLHSMLARVTISISPETAELSVDGRADAGIGADRDLILDPGDHVIVATASGHRARTIEVTLAAGARETRQVALERMPEQPAHLVVRASPDTARVTIDDVEAGSGDVDVAAGRHLIRASAEGYRDLRRIVVLAPGERLEVDARLSREDGGSIAEEPALWIVTTLIVLAGAAAGVTAWWFLEGEQPYGGSAGFTIAGLASF